MLQIREQRNIPAFLALSHEVIPTSLTPSVKKGLCKWHPSWVFTWGTPSQSSACCMASLAFSTGWFGSHSAQSGHKPGGKANRQIKQSCMDVCRLRCTAAAIIRPLRLSLLSRRHLQLQQRMPYPHFCLIDSKGATMTRRLLSVWKEITSTSALALSLRLKLASSCAANA